MDDTHTFRHGDSSPGFSQCEGDKSISPESSCVSMRIDASMDHPIKFKGKHTSTDLSQCEGERSISPESSCVSMKSDQSMGEPMRFEGKHTSTDLRFSKLLLLLFYFINYSGTSTKPVSGTKGGNVTLTCESEDREITHISLFHQADEIPVCETEECKSENDRVFKEGSCDIIIKDLRLSDAGKYILRVYYTNDQAELERQITEYHLHIHEFWIMKEKP